MDNWIEQLEGRRLLSASVSLGTLTVSGTESADRIIITQNKKFVLVREGSQLTRFNQFTRISHISQVIVNGLGGNDRIKVTSKLNATIDGGEGNDLIQAGAGSDVLLGGNGNDRILGQAGNDSVSGGAGRDVLFGGAGDDVIDAFDTEADQVAGGAGDDSARVDTHTDAAWNIEDYLAVTTNSSGSITDISNDSVVNVNAGKLIINTGANGGTGSVSLDFNGTADSVNVLNTLTLSGNATLNMNAITGFTTGTYRLFTMTNFTDTGDIVIGTTSGSGAFNYAIVEPTPTSPVDPQPAATAPVVVIVDEDPAAAQPE